MLPSHSFCNEASAEKAAKPKVVTSRYKDRPWDYLESEGANSNDNNNILNVLDISNSHCV